MSRRQHHRAAVMAAPRARRVAELGKAKRCAIDAVAAHFSAPWEIAENPPDAYLAIRGRRIALDVAIIARPSRSSRAAPGRLREDRVAQRALRDLRSALHAHVPSGKSIILTLGAPIKVPKKLLAALTKLLPHYIHSAVEERDEKKTVFGNRVRFRVVNHDLRWEAKVIGLVFSGDPAPGAIAESLRMIHDAVLVASQRADVTSDRWLILSSDGWIADIKTYRVIYSLLSLARSFKKIYMVFDASRVEALMEGR